MNPILISSETLELLSKITGKKLELQDVTTPLIFLSALIAVLVGVMFIDETVEEEEKEHWQITINRFISTECGYRELAKQIARGIQEYSVYRSSKRLSLLTAPLSLAERFLLISLGYEMSAADGKIEKREKKYLENIALELGIRAELLEVLEAGFTAEISLNPSAIDEVRDLLSPSRFGAIESLFLKLPAF